MIASTIIRGLASAPSRIATFFRQSGLKQSIVLGYYQNSDVASKIFYEMQGSEGFNTALLSRDNSNRLRTYGNVSSQTLEAYSRWLVRGETLILSEVPLKKARQLLQTMRQNEDELPVTFIFYPESGSQTLKISDLIFHEPLTPDQMMQVARDLSAERTIEAAQKRGRPLLDSLVSCELSLKQVRLHLSEAARADQSLLLSAEWLLDNAYIIQGHITDFKRNLPRRYYQQLPIMAGGPSAGLPRAYRIAAALVESTDGTLDRETIYTFLHTYQAACPLTIGELWVLPLMLRLRLIERLSDLALKVDLRQRERELADFWASRLIAAARHDPDQLLGFIADLSREYPSPTSHFAEHLVGHLYDEESVLLTIQKWLERKLELPLAEAIIQEQREQAVQQISLGNSINSLRLLSRMAWRELFESVSRVDHVLQSDPASIYERMSFSTRDRYRHAVEQISRTSRKSEIDVSLEALQLAEEQIDPIKRHIGYYLIDEGRPELEKKIGCRVRMAWKLRRAARKYHTTLYLGSVGLLTLFILSIIYLLSWKAFTGAGSYFLLLLALLPISEIAIQLVNYLITRLLPPDFLPRMSFDEGIPDAFRTLVVVPMMLLTPESIQEELEKLEIRYLANPDENLRYALLSDYSDAQQQHMPKDVELQDITARAIENLNAKYGSPTDPINIKENTADGTEDNLALNRQQDARIVGPFLLFHREREWSESEQSWMGWERKRGKLEQLNAYLMGETLSTQPDFLRAGDPTRLKNIRFVLTLDSDTQLPRDTGQKLVETLAHPLNQPVLNESTDAVRPNQNGSLNLNRGYSLLQPRVTTALPSATASFFSRLFTDTTGTDPYTNVVSDVYQDLTGEGSYHGKGIYDLKAFHTLLQDRFPTNHLLSHDLIEGVHVRTAYVSDIELFDQFPRDYVSYAGRQHRWVRGDWQIADWLLPKVPRGSEKQTVNSLSIFNRWKIFDNLRRSLLPLSAVVLLTAAWLLSAIPANWSILIALMVLMPTIIGLLDVCTRPPKNESKPWKDLGLSLLRSIIFAALLPQQALLNLDAIYRVWYRRQVSRRLLMEWETASEAHNKAKNRSAQFVRNMAGISLFGILFTLLLHFTRPGTLDFAGPFLVLWIISPLIVAWLNSETAVVPERALSEPDKKYLRQVGRQTWRFFDTFVNSESNWLPPDNYQAQIRVEIAPRTSPTNIGLWFLAALAAQDMGYITIDEMLDRTNSSFQTLDKLERFEGHIYNWYDLNTLKPLPPRYVSMVDSGNMLGHLWTFAEGVEEKLAAPVLDSMAISSLEDTIVLLRHALDAGRTSDSHSLSKGHSDRLRLSQIAENTGLSHSRSGMHVSLLKRIETISNLCAAGRTLELPALISRLRTLRSYSSAMADEMRAELPPGDEIRYWGEQIEKQVEQWNITIDRYLSWIEVLIATPDEGLLSLSGDVHKWRRDALAAHPTVQDLAVGSVPGMSGLMSIRKRADFMPTSEAMLKWLDLLVAAFEGAEWYAREKLTIGENVLSETHRFADEMKMGFLYDKERKLFSIGYNVEDRRLDNSYYDLLASEARLGSFIAIARNEIPAEHWFALGRPFVLAYGQRVMLSWSGTMFEYLMPLLVMRAYDNSLLNQVCNAVVAAQISYGKERGIPWGISEAGYSGLDSRQIYQYRAFGVPGLGLKRGLEEDTVVAPYAAALALMVAPRSAIANLRRMSRLSPVSLRGDYGFYEAIDFTRQADPTGGPGVIVYEYMAHHQAMSLLAIDNVLHRDVMHERFHRDPRVKATESLLYERTATSAPLAKDYATRAPLPRLTTAIGSAGVGRVEGAYTVVPRTHLLSNADYSVMVTNSGSGYSRWKDIEVTRWRADTTMDNWGSYCFVRDRAAGLVWSATHQPTGIAAKSYSVLFTTEKAEFRRRDGSIETVTDIIVSPEDNVEIRRLTIINHSVRPREIELTSYVEVALATHVADRAHPAFSKLFVQTEFSQDPRALLAWRRPRASTDLIPWAVHLLASQKPVEQPVTYETDRARFIGRNRSLRAPAALETELSGTTGAVLDPIFSLRAKLTLQPNERVQIAFITGAGDSRESVIHLAKKYSEYSATTRAFELAWTHAQLDLRHLRIQPEIALRYQQLAGYILYPSSRLRAGEDRLRRNMLPQSRLWSHGISGDLPIVLITVDSEDDLDLVQQVMQAHAYWRARGLKSDLVILNEESSGYLQPMQEQLRRMVLMLELGAGLDTPGGVFIRPASQISEEDKTLLFTIARVAMVAARGSLVQQMAAQAPPPALQPTLRKSTSGWEEPSAPLPFLELNYFNGLGGFTPDGREYIIYLGPNKVTPAPWINVMANPQFGATMSESGVGFCWYGNSQTNRLTAWSNDPVRDPASDAIYLRDDELDVAWTPTPSPIRELDAYRTHHGQGYTLIEHNSHAIEQELLTFVPVFDSLTDGDRATAGAKAATGDPVRIQRLRLRNKSSHRRKLTVTFYCEWTLGTDREDTQMHVVTQWDSASKSMLARNSYNPDFGSRIAFAACTPSAETYTGDRTEFVGRNGNLSSPAAARRQRLNNRVGAGLDPCAALQTTIELETGAQVDLLFLIGQAQDVDDARRLVKKYTDKAQVERAYRETTAWWDRTLETIQVETPDLAVNYMLNRWLLYQDISCRLWGRSAFYQSGGAYGFRDQLQDVCALVYADPKATREQLLRSASRQFVEGDVQHWWHPPGGAGVRTHISDDLLWLPYVTAHYVRVTGDTAVLDEQSPFLDGKPLGEGEHESFNVPDITVEKASLLEHCRRAIKKGLTSGPHGLPLIGAGDWNDGLNRVGIEGRGESVWLGWFLIHVLRDFSELLRLTDQSAEAEDWEKKASELALLIEEHAWDGEWYRRAFYDDGTPLGSAQSEECKIDSLPQSWAVISRSGRMAGAANRERSELAMQAVMKYLVREKEKMITLFTPPFDQTDHDPGYIKGYLPGVRENGGQYTHGSLWVPLAFARLGDGDTAVHLLTLMNPVEHARTTEEANHYRVEPYVVCADVYSLAGQEGRGGWTWYTGSAGWMYRIWIEEIMGLRVRGTQMQINPVVPRHWPECKFRYRHLSSQYHITISNPDGVSEGVISVTLDERKLPDGNIPLVSDGKTHQVKILLGVILVAPRPNNGGV